MNTLLDDISAEIGYTATCTLRVWYGGAALRVPRTVSQGALMTLIGEPALKRLIRRWAGEDLWIPQGHEQMRSQRDRDILKMSVSGWEPKQIADSLGLSRRRVEQVLEFLKTGEVFQAIGGGGDEGDAEQGGSA